MKIFITGENRLAAEYAEVCAEHGHSVSVHFCETESHPASAAHKNITVVKAPPRTAELAIELTNCSRESKMKSIGLIDSALDMSVPILCSTVTVTATECAGWLMKQRVLIGISALPSFLSNGLVELAVPANRTDEGVDAAGEFFKSLGKEISVIDDRVGMVLPRILAQVINEAMLASSQQLAPPEVIDTAMKLGADYPRGPIEWLDAITALQVVAVLDALYRDTGDDRYAATPLLRKIALAGEFWKNRRQADEPTATGWDKS